jgi:hypothetical protein
MKRRHVYSKAILIMVVLIVGLVCGLVFIRYAMPNILAARYKSQINDAYASFYTPDMDTIFNNMGVTFKSAGPAECPNGPYSPSSLCNKSQSNDYTTVNEVSKTKWEKYGKELDAYLSKNSWRRVEDSRDTTFADLLNKKDPYQVYADYEQKKHGATCYVSADFVTDAPGSLSVSRGCYKNASSRFALY